MSSATGSHKKKDSKGKHIETSPDKGSQEEDVVDLVESPSEISPTQSDINLFWEDLSENKVKGNEPSTSGSSSRTRKMPAHEEEKGGGNANTEIPETDLLPCSSCEFPDPMTCMHKAGCLSFFARRKSREPFSEFWLISVPKESDTLDRLNSETYRSNLSQNYKFHIPKFKIGTLDDLISLIEQLSTLDNYVGDVTGKLCYHIKNELANRPDLLEENLQVRSLNPVTFLTRFTWNSSKYPTWYRIRRIADTIYTHVDKISHILKEKSSLRDTLKKGLKRYADRSTENLQTRYLGDIVKKEHLVLDSQYFTTLLVVVPTDKEKRWLKSYINFSDMVVPQSSIKLFEDSSHCLFNVTLCKKNVEQFKKNAQKNSFFVRDFEYSETDQKADKEEFDRLIREKVMVLASIFRWTKINFSECFEAWIHVKALRIFVESVLRFGLPVNFLAILILPLKSRSKLRKLLNNLYSKVDIPLAAGTMHEIPGCLTVYGVEEYYPYISLNINLGFITGLTK